MKKYLLFLFLLTSYNVIAQVQFASKLIEYKPAPGQFINKSPGLPEDALKIIGGIDGTLTLGYFGGYVVVGFDQPIQNHKDNPYGVDFTVFGNAFLASSEPGIVMVMKDENKNGEPDDTWYELRGSNHFLSSTIYDYQITYTNPKDSIDVPWVDNQGNNGVVVANNFHKQPYYPKTKFFPEINQEQYTLSGTLIKSRTFQDAYTVNYRYDYGYVDNLSKNYNQPLDVPDNPYTLNELEGCGGDAFDISWAIDAEGNPVDLDEISFIKVYNAVAADGGAVGEISTEIKGISVVKPNPEITGITDVIVSNTPPLQPTYPVGENFIINKASDFQFEAYVISKGKLNDNQNIIWKSSDESVATIDETGKLSGIDVGEVTITAHWDENDQIKRSYNIIVATSVSNAHDSYNPQFTFYPNPAKDFVNFNQVQETQIKIISITGVVVKDFYSRDAYKRVSISDLKPGIYFVQFQKENNLKTLRLVKR